MEVGCEPGLGFDGAEVLDLAPGAATLVLDDPIDVLDTLLTALTGSVRISMNVSVNVSAASSTRYSTAGTAAFSIDRPRPPRIAAVTFALATRGPVRSTVAATGSSSSWCTFVYWHPWVTMGLARRQSVRSTGTSAWSGWSTCVLRTW